MVVKKWLSFDKHNVLYIKTDKLIAIMTKLATQNNNKAKQFKPKIYPGDRRGHDRNNYYDRGR